MSFLFNRYFQKKKTPNLYTDANQVLSDLGSTKKHEDSPSSLKGNASISTIDSPSFDKYFRPQASPKLPVSSLTLSSNSASVLNMHMSSQNRTIMENIYGILENGVSFPEFLSTQQDSSQPSSLSTVSDEEFSDYVEKLRGSYKTYVTEKEQSTTESFEQESKRDITGNLMQCYLKIPGQYFDEPERFVFNFSSLEQDTEQLLEMQKELAEYTDLVEKNLFTQISIKSGAILDAINRMTSQEKRIAHILAIIAAIRERNKNLKANIADKVEDVMRNKRRQINMQRTLQVMETMNLVKKIAPAVEQLIQKGNFDAAVGLLDSSEATLRQKLNSTKALQGFNTMFTQARTTLQQRLGAEFEKQALNYLSQSLLYSKNEEGWVLDKKATIEDQGREVERIAKLVQAQFRLKEVSLTGFRPKLHEMLKKFHKNIMTEIELLNGDRNSNKRAIFGEKMQLIRVYYQAQRAFFERFTSIHNNVLKKAVAHCDLKLKEDGNNFQETLKALTQTVQEFYSVYGVAVRGISDRIGLIMQTIDTKEMTVEEFTMSYSKLFDEALIYFKEKLVSQEKVTGDILNSCSENVRKGLGKTIASFLDQISMSPLANLRMIIERQFAQGLLIRKKDEAITALKQDKWQPIELKEEYLKLFKVFYDSSEGIVANNSLTINGHNNSASSPTAEKSPTSDDEKSSMSSLDGFEVTSSSPIVYPHGIEIHGRVYKVTSSYLELINTIFELTSASRNLSSVKEEACTKIWQIIRSFISALDHEILKGNAASGVITPDILALAAISAELLTKGVPVYGAKLDREGLMTHTILHYESLEAKSEAAKLSKALLGKVGEILREVVIMDRCGKLKTVNWSADKSTGVNTVSLQLLDKVKAVYKKISKILPPNMLKITFSGVLIDISKYYLDVFENFNVKDAVIGKKIKEELEGFMREVRKCGAFSGLEAQIGEFEQKVKMVIGHKCEPFIALAAMHEDEKEVVKEVNEIEKKEGSESSLGEEVKE